MVRDKTASKAEPFVVADRVVAPGRRETIELPVGRLPTGTSLTLPIAVLNGTRPGPTVWLNAAIHGDELNGIAVVRQVVRQLKPKSLAGTVIAVPIVN
ncbi:MAG: succinylglutamate desuccinylase/aspartoacylase family protein, partial [Myxococcota bacterium]